MNGMLARAGRALDGFYGVAHAFACACVAAIAGLIVVQVLGRTLDKALQALDLPVTGFQIHSIDDIAGTLFAVGAFLAMASTLRHGVHIRVTLLLDNVPAGVARILKIVTALLGAALFGYAAWNMGLIAQDSHRFNDVSPGVVAFPYWVPQAAITLGLAAFALAMLHEALVSFRRSDPTAHAEPNDAARGIESDDPASQPARMD